ncbi:type ISP restriction/modification enzyme [Micromonospora peucetia]|uniref:type ISP restriction/modification enzyme n=1 Tax=Micromonospora peucetia TaxID=47871 RepID=UPI003332B510
MLVEEWLAQAVAEFGRECKTGLDGPGEREAAIRPPIERLLATFCDKLGLNISMYSEVHLEYLNVRPDYAIRINRVITGYLEVKKPAIAVEASGFRGKNKVQWERLKDLPNLLYSNGQSWALYRTGEKIGETAHLTGDLATAGGKLLIQDEQFERLLRDFVSWHPAPIRSVGQLVRAVAPLCRLLREEVLDQLDREASAMRGGQAEDEQLFTVLAREWRKLLFPTADNKTFSDGYAQTVTFALLLARSEGISLEGRSLHEVGKRLGATHSLMGRALQLLTDTVQRRFQVSIDLLARVIDAVNWEHIRKSNVDAYVHLYEHFLEQYDEGLRKSSGTYYTPREVVTEMVRLVEEVLQTRLGRTDGFRSPNVFTVDPAMGTGTFLHEIIKRVGDQAAEQDGPGAVPSTIEELASRLAGFEMQMGPFAVAELRGSDMLRNYEASLPPGGLKLYVTNTLDDPFTEETQIPSVFSQISRSRRLANEIKKNTPVTVVIGNPPYRERAEGQGGWIEQGGEGTPPPLNAFRAPGNGKYENALKNLYVYFWRWATWKAFDAQPNQGDGVVAFITTAGYLRGAGFKGMREYLRRTCDEGWVIDVSPEGMRPDVATRIFPGVQQPLAIGIFVRRSTIDLNKPAKINCHTLQGHRNKKYDKLRTLTLDSDSWLPAREEWQAAFTPASETEWDEYPALGDLLPWSITGVTPNRAWVYGPSRLVLERRWNELVAADQREDRARLFKETRDRRIDSKVMPLPGQNPSTTTIAEETGAAPAAVRVAYRSFDRQWILADNRLTDMARPDLWRTLRPGQIFVNEQHTRTLKSGPGITLTALIPDVDHFKGSEGGRVLPMMHANGAPNIADQLLPTIGERLQQQPAPEDLIAYIAGVVAHRAFTGRFAVELVTPGIRVPLTADPALWNEAVSIGREVAWLHTYGGALVDQGAGRPAGAFRYPAGDLRRVVNTKAVPATPLPAAISYDAKTETLHVGAGEFAPVPEEVWNYDVGGMPVVRKWFSYRKAEPGGKMSSPLDNIHAERWPHEWNQELMDLLSTLRRLVELESQQSDVLDRIVAGPQISVAELHRSGVLPIPDIAQKPQRAATTPGSGAPDLFSLLD